MTDLAWPRRHDARHATEVAALHEHDRKHSRPTYSDIIDRLLAVMTRTGGGDHSSVKLTRNSKGDTQIEVMVRTGEYGIDNIDNARLIARQQYDLLTALYPMTGNGATE